MERPIVLTSGNRSDEPQAIHRDDARQRLGAIAGYFLEHDRPIARRVDDSVTRVMSGRSRLLRRARGFAPATLPLPPGFESAPFVLGCGGELKNTFCLLREGGAVLSAHIGGLHDPLTRADRAAAVADFERFHEFAPAALACDLHPDYFSTQSARERSRRQRLPLVECQHHHAHLAACLAENGVPRDAPAVLGVVLDGTGYGADGTIWGGEFLRADYLRCERLGTFKPVAMLGGDAAIHEPWRSTYAHIMAQMGWAGFAQNYAGLELYRFLESRPRDLLDAMLARRINAPLASSCGRLFDAVAAALGLARERARFEGEGAMQLEAAADRAYLGAASGAPAARPPVYPFPIPRLAGGGLPYIEPLGMWAALFGDLVLGTPLGVMSARFHLGLADAIVRMVRLLTVATPGVATPLSTVALSGGVFQNRVLFEHVEAALRRDGFEVLSHAAVPCNDGGIALGQAVIAAARLMRHAAAPPAAHH
jgi:hydrogenase maturation protein HypF